MIKFITNWFNNQPSTEEVLTEREQMKSTSLTYQYLEKYITNLNPGYRYDVQEQLKSGTIITHKRNVTHQDAVDYIRMIYIESCPPNIILNPVHY